METALAQLHPKTTTIPIFQPRSMTQTSLPQPHSQAVPLRMVRAQLAILDYLHQVYPRRRYDGRWILRVEVRVTGEEIKRLETAFIFDDAVGLI